MTYQWQNWSKLYFWAQRPHSFYLISPDVWLIPHAVPDNDHVHIISCQVICRPSDQSDGSQDESPRTQWGGLVFLLAECRGAGDIVILSRQELPGSTGLYKQRQKGALGLSRGIWGRLCVLVSNTLELKKNWTDTVLYWSLWEFLIANGITPNII